MISELTILAEEFRAQFAFVRLFPGVSLYVFSQLVRIGKSFATQLTQVLLFIVMDCHMSRMTGHCQETLFADITLVWFFFRVHALVTF